MTEELKGICEHFIEIIERGDWSFAREYLVQNSYYFPSVIQLVIEELDACDARVPSEARMIGARLQVIYNRIREGTLTKYERP